jgi:Mn2+/Fe2+ NRAMP family transporter
MSLIYFPKKSVSLYIKNISMKLLQKIKSLGPGLLFAGAAIGVSHLVQSTRAGAEYGLGLLWALVIIHLVKYPFFQYGPRYAMATGESLIQGYKRLGKWVLALYVFLTFIIMFTIQAAVTIVTAGLAINLFGLTDNMITWAIILTIISLGILIIGKYAFLDKVMKVIIVVLSISSIIAVLLALKNPVSTLNFTQILPRGKIGIAFLIAFLGWMPAPLDVSVWQSLWTIEKKKENNTYNSKAALFDYNIGYIATLFLGVCFILLGALVMFQSGENFSANAGKFSQQLINLYTQNLGSGMAIFISIAAFTTMFSTTITTLDASPRSLSKAMKVFIDKKSKLNYNFWIIILAIGTIIILTWFIQDMKLMVKIATIFSFITAPFYAIANYILITSKHTPKEHQPKLPLRILSIVGIVFLVGFTIWFLTSL